MVIIGLLAAGILVGRSMIKSAQLQQIASNFLKFRDATKQFHDKYKYFPGDLPTAIDFWGQSSMCGGIPAAPTTETCNGNGDGFVTGPVGTPVQFGAEFREALFFWQHLTNSNFLEGTYSGQASGGIDWWQPGDNMPEGRDKNSGYTFSYSTHGTHSYTITYPDLSSVTGDTFNSNYGHIISYGNPRDIGNRRTASGVALSGSEALAIDQKIDDGKPGLGNILAIPNSADGISYLCVDNGNPTSAVYMTARSDKLCAIVFITGL